MLQQQQQNLPQPPQSFGSAPGPGQGGGSSGLDGSMRWSSRENLLTAADEEDPQLYVALYDFQAGGENQLSLKKGNKDLLN